MECISEHRLSEFIDHALTDMEMARHQRHIDGCMQCRQEMDAYAEMEAALQQFLAGHASADSIPVPSLTPSRCPNAELLYRHLTDSLPTRQQEQIEAHLLECDHCLLNLQNMAIFNQRFGGETAVPVSHALRTTVEKRWIRDTVNHAKKTDVVAAVIQFVESGLRVFMDAGKPENMTFGVLPLDFQPLRQTTTRGTAELKTNAVYIHKQFPKTDIELQLNAFKETNETLRLSVTVFKAAGGLARCRLSLYRDDSLLMSKITSNNGTVSFSDMRPGRYWLKIAQENIEWTFCILAPTESD